MSVNSAEYKIALDAIVKAMKIAAGSEDMASVQINSAGACIFRRGLTHGDHFTVDEFATKLDEIISRHLADGGV